MSAAEFHRFEELERESEANERKRRERKRGPTLGHKSGRKMRNQGQGGTTWRRTMRCIAQ